ncbi:hypothetical protein HYU11_03680 [Candidatus Woesearchaeota archaeon]|nr:hypothetical protein [Candidatus Woesearchaeota archaeon]
MLRNKSAASQWLSWVLLVGLAAVLGIFMLNWIRDTASTHTEDLKLRAERATLCTNIGVRIDGLCQNTQTLNMNVSNNNDAGIKSILVLMIDIYGDPQLRETNITILPEESKELKIVKQGIVQKIEVVPSTYLGNKRIDCQEKRVATEIIPIC